MSALIYIYISHHITHTIIHTHTNSLCQILADKEHYTFSPAHAPPCKTWLRCACCWPEDSLRHWLFFSQTLVSWTEVGSGREDRHCVSRWVSSNAQLDRCISLLSGVNRWVWSMSKRYKIPVQTTSQSVLNLWELKSEASCKQQRHYNKVCAAIAEFVLVKVDCLTLYSAPFPQALCSVLQWQMDYCCFVQILLSVSSFSWPLQLQPNSGSELSLHGWVTSLWASSSWLKHTYMYTHTIRTAFCVITQHAETDFRWQADGLTRVFPLRQTVILH